MQAFISWNYDESKTVISSIRKILIKNNIEMTDDFDLIRNPTDIYAVEYKIEKSDFFICIIDSLSPKLFYEIGIASGLKKPIFVVISRNIINIPGFLNDFTYIRANIDEIEIIEFPLIQFMNNLPKHKKLKSKQAKEKKTITLPSTFERSLTDLRKSGSGKQIEEYISSLFKSYELTIKPVTKDTGVDFVLWLDEINSILGNIMLVDVKYGDIDEGILSNSEGRLYNNLIKTNSKLGLLLYLDRNGKKFKLGRSINPLIIRMDIEDFIKEIEKSKSLYEVIVECRNKIAHGMED